MTKQQKADLYYMTQYAHNMSDEQFFERIDNRVAHYDLNFELFVEIAEKMTQTPDAINEKLFDEMIDATSNADLEIISMILSAVENEDVFELDKLTNNKLDRFLNEYDIHDEDYFTMLADFDLRDNGINAFCLSWANDIPSNFDYAELDVYNNFTTMTTAEVIEKFFDEYY